MKIGIDLSMVDEKKAGIGYYIFELTKELLKIDQENEYHLFTNDPEVLKDLVKSNSKIVQINGTVNFLWFLKLSIKLRTSKINIAISSSNLIIGFLFSNTIQIINDLLPLKYPEMWPNGAAKKFERDLKLSVKRTKCFATISQTTLDDLIDRFPKIKDRSYYLGTGLHEWTQKKYSEDYKLSIKNKYKLPESYFFSISTIQPRKNYKNMILAFKKFLKANPDFYYVITGGKGWYYEEIFELVKEQKLEEKVWFLGYTDERDLPALLIQSRGLLFLSFDEGFGIPPLEAYSQGVPSLISDIPVLREVMENYAIYANPNDLDEISLKMEELKERKKFVPEEKHLQKHSWKAVAKRIIKLYHEFKT